MFPPTLFLSLSKVPQLDLDLETVLATEDYLSYLSLGTELHTPCAPVLHPQPLLPSHILHSIAARKERGGAP